MSSVRLPFPGADGVQDVGYHFRLHRPVQGKQVVGVDKGSIQQAIEQGRWRVHGL
jgi:hypothetical protein